MLGGTGLDFLILDHFGSFREEFSTVFFLTQINVSGFEITKKIGVYGSRFRNADTNIRIGSNMSTVLVVRFELCITNQ